MSCLIWRLRVVLFLVVSGLISQEIWISPTWGRAVQEIVRVGSLPVNDNTPILMPFGWDAWMQIYPPQTTNRLDNTRFGHLWDPGLIGVNYPVKITELEFFSTFVHCEPREIPLPDGGRREVCFWPSAFANYPYPVHLYNWDINHRTSASPVLVIYELGANQLHNNINPRLYQSIFRPTKAETSAGMEYTRMDITFRDWRNPPARTGVYFHRFRIPERGQFVLNPNKRYVVAVSTVPFVDNEIVWPEMEVEPAIVTAPNLSGPFIECSANQTSAPLSVMVSALGSAVIDDIRIPVYNYSCGDPYYYWPNSFYRSRHGHICHCIRIHRELNIASPFDESRDARPSLGVVGIKGVRLNTCGADVDCSGCVDDADLLGVLFKFGESGYPREDVNGDFSIDDADLLQVLFNFGSGC